MTKADWGEALEILAEILGRPVQEFHAKKFYRGDGIWRDIDGPQRAAIITGLLEWFAGRGHYVVYSCVDRAKFDAAFALHAFSSDVGSLWRLLGFHVVLSLQKHHQRERRNKGHTVLVFDEQVIEKDAFRYLLDQPPTWSETYYARRDNQDPLDQIVDTPHFVDSRQVLLIQVADLMAFILRRYLELEVGGAAESYNGEHARIRQWTDTILNRGIDQSAIYPRRNLCDAARYFQEFAPDCFLG